MAVVVSVKVKLAYEDATSRTYTFNGVADSVLPNVKDQVIGINESIVSDSADGLAFAETFVSDKGSKCIGITDARIIKTNQVVIYSAS